MSPGDQALARFGALVALLSDGVTLWDEDGVLLLANPAFWRIVGLDPAEGPARLTTSGWSVVDEDGAPLPYERFPAVRALREGATETGRILGLDRPDGTRAWVSVSAAPASIDGGREAVASITDVTARHEAREAIRAGRDLLSSMIDGVPEIMVLRDAGGRYLAVNQAFCAWVGRGRDEIIGRPSRDVLPPEWVPAADAALARMAALRSPWSIEAPEPVTGRTWRISRTPFLDAAGGFAGVVCIASDVSEYRALEEELRRANAELEQRVGERTAELERANQELEAFSYRVSHDLRAPLRAIQGFSRALEEQLGTSAPGDLRRIQEGTAAMAALIDALLGLSQAGRRAAGLERTTVDLRRLAEQAAADLAPVARVRRVVIEVGDLPMWPADGPLVRQVLANLLSNAVKFSRPEGGRVRVTSRRHETELVVAVEDDGVGFEDGAGAAAMFGPFERLPNSIGVEGAGIGLAIVQRIVTAHGGRVWASGAPGGGAGFSFSLPAHGRQIGGRAS